MNKKLRKRFLSKDAVTLYAVIIAYVVVSIMLYGGFASRQLSSMLISLSMYIVMAVSLNLAVGFLGELSLGHAGFMSVGLFSGCIFSIYTSSILPLVIRLPLAMIIGGLFAALAGFIIGLPALRLKGDYLAIVTLACGEIIKNAFTNLKISAIDFDGALGLYTQKIDSVTGNEVYNILCNVKTLLPYAIALVLITIIVIMNLKKSRHGRAIMAIRDNRIAAESTGINVTYYKLIVFIIAAFFAGAAGVVYGHSLANVKASTFDYNMSIEILVIVVLGGMGNIPGSIIAAIILKALPEALRDFSDYRMLAYSILLIAIMLLNSNPKFKEFRESLRIKNIAVRMKNKKKEGTENG